MHSPILLAALLTALCLQPTTTIPSPFTPARNLFTRKLFIRQPACLSVVYSQDSDCNFGDCVRCIETASGKKRDLDSRQIYDGRCYDPDEYQQYLNSMVGSGAQGTSAALNSGCHRGASKGFCQVIGY